MNATSAAAVSRSVSDATFVVIQTSSPLDPRVAPLLVELDAYLYRIYPVEEFPPEINHILDPQSLTHSSVTFLVAWVADQAVGCGAVRRMTDEEGAYGEIKRMFVKPEMRGQQIAEKILQHLDTAVRSEGISRLLLETGVRQPEAMRLYERCGYTVRGSFGGYSDDFVSVFMEKSLVANVLVEKAA
jgi:putative acetyltransferase